MMPLNNITSFACLPSRNDPRLLIWTHRGIVLYNSSIYTILHTSQASILRIVTYHFDSYGMYRCLSPDTYALCLLVTSRLLQSSSPSRSPDSPFVAFGLKVNKIRGKRAVSTLSNEHRPRNYTWLVRDFENNILYQISNRTIWPWFPVLHFDFAQMGTGYTKFKDKELQADPWDKQGSCTPSPKQATKLSLYFCPAHSTGSSRSHCGGVSDQYCRSWDCVSTGAITWDAPTKNDYIQIMRAGTTTPSCKEWNCCGKLLNPMNISFTSKGKTLSKEQWATGFTWGGREWSGDGDDGNIFTIKLTIQMASISVGPNTAMHSSFLLPQTSESPDPLIILVNSSLSLLRTTINDSDKTDRCWLCLSSTPPFYEAVGSTEPIRNSTHDKDCRWNSSVITINSIQGPGCCLGHIPSNYSQYCLNSSANHHCELWLPKSRSDVIAGLNQVYTTSGENIIKRLKGQYFIPGNNSVWACSTGTTACAYGDVLISQKAFCIQVRLVPKLTYFSPQEFINIMEPAEYPLRQKREVVTALTLSVLLGLGVTGAATGVAALAVNRNEIARLSMEVDGDLKRIETSITALQDSLSSLAEVTLQNRRGLDLLFLSKGGLCVALKEECCFYADHSGIVKDSMSELRKRLKDREYERQNNQSWYQGMFNFSPWLTTLLSALLGPIILLIIVCTIGPCILGKLLHFLKSRLDTLDSSVGIANEQISLLSKTLQPNVDKMPLLEFSDDEREEEIHGWSTDQEDERHISESDIELEFEKKTCMDN